ncbi:MAG: hypothetical protein VB957_16630 [Pseudomonadales bacterium]
MDHQYILYETKQQTAHIRLNRPQYRLLKVASFWRNWMPPLLKQWKMMLSKLSSCPLWVITFLQDTIWERLMRKQTWNNDTISKNFSLITT